MKLKMSEFNGCMTWPIFHPFQQSGCLLSQEWKRQKSTYIYWQSCSNVFLSKLKYSLSLYIYIYWLTYQSIKLLGSQVTRKMIHVPWRKVQLNAAKLQICFMRKGYHANRAANYPSQVDSVFKKANIYTLCWQSRK